MLNKASGTTGASEIAHPVLHGEFQQLPHWISLNGSLMTCGIRTHRVQEVRQVLKPEEKMLTKAFKKPNLDFLLN